MHNDSNAPRGRHARASQAQAGGRAQASPQVATPSDVQAQAQAWSRDRAQAQVKARTAKKSKRWTIVFVIALVVFIGALAALGVIAFSYWQGQQSYNRVTEVANIEQADDFDLEQANVDWAALQAVNPDIVAWIYIPNTNINYPVVKGTDDSYYLTHDFEGAQGGVTNNGCIFLHYENESDFSDKGNFIFGHHLNDGTMFSALADEATFNDHRTVYLFTPQKNYKLRSFSLVHCASTDPLMQISFGTGEQLESYLSDIVSRSVAQVSDIPEVSSINRFFALSTCDNLISNGRYVLFCAVEETGSPK